MDSHIPPPPYTPRDNLTPTSSNIATPNTIPLHLEQHRNDGLNGPSHDYSAYEQVLPETDPNLSELDEPLPAYHPRSELSPADGDRGVPNYTSYIHVSSIPSNVPVPHGVSRRPTLSVRSPARTPSSPTSCEREASHSAPYGFSALQRIMDSARELSDRSAEQVARSSSRLMPKRQSPSRPSAIRRNSASSSSSSREDSLSGADSRGLEDLDLTTLRTSIANLMRDPRNKDEVLQAVTQLRDDLHNRRDHSVLKQQVKEFEAEVQANRKKVKAMRKEAKAVQKAESRESRLERRVEMKAKKAGLTRLEYRQHANE
ncbi:hypothetical protein MMC16_000712 [Acarospora aff. strigata]|nr:hypothetical protein [Acarospora aff. strigata]